MKQLQNQNSMTDKKTTIGVIGCSTIAANSVIPAIKSSKNIELTSIGSRNQEKSKKFAEQFGSKKFGCGLLVSQKFLQFYGDGGVLLAKIQ